ncbi:MAG: efflux RND transporter periplasmic adaptor subunit [Chloroflexota bacterium]
MAVLTVIAAGVYFAWPSANTEAVEPALQTAKVRTGDLAVTASGSGTVVPASEVDLGFRTSGVVSELNVSVGEAVASAEILARLEDNLQAEADFQSLFSSEGAAQAELAFADAQAELEDAILGLKYLLGADAYYWDTQMKQAEAILGDPTASADQKTEAQKAFDAARTKFEYFLQLNIRSLASDNVFVTEADIALARANLELARVLLQDAQAAREIVQTGPEALTKPIVALGPRTEELEQARLAVENTRLVAPFDGTVTSLDAVVGQTVYTSSVMSISTTQDLLVRFYLDETDVSKAATGNRVTFTFDAYPDLPVNGEIISVEPALQTVDGTPVVVAWAKLTEESAAVILSGMTVEVEVIAAEARDALLVPVQALRELAPGSYAVFVVQADGSLQMTPVTVGLRDYANAEILSGLKVGDVVSTGTVETK